MYISKNEAQPSKTSIISDNIERAKLVNTCPNPSYAAALKNNLKSHTHVGKGLQSFGGLLKFSVKSEAKKSFHDSRIAEVVGHIFELEDHKFDSFSVQEIESLAFPFKFAFPDGYPTMKTPRELLVHAARTHDGQRVAVKVQHTHMTDTAAADYATVDLIVNTLHWFFPSFDYRWLVDEMRESLPKELDFLIEAKNSIKCMDNFRRLSPHIAGYVYAPKVHWNLSTTKLLVMEFIDGAQVNDFRTIQKLGIHPSDVSKLLSQAFAEMMFKHGFVHCDPHAANVLIRPLPSGIGSILGCSS